jgi:type III secretion system low calcium response chaperone LcrH/SycD
MEPEKNEAEGALDDAMINEVQSSAANYEKVIEKGTRNVVDNMFQRGMLLRDASGMGPERAEALYAEAYHLFKIGKYREAQAQFITLVTMNPYEFKYMFGLASCSHLLKKYENAADLYMQSATLEKDNPIPYFHASDCFFNTKDTFAGVAALNMCVNLCGDKPEFAIIKDRAEIMIKSHPVEEMDLKLDEEDANALKEATANANIEGTQSQETKPKTTNQ